jgi:hypothetical protein
LTRRRLTVQEAAEVLGITVDAARMRARRGSLDSEHDEGRLYIWLDTDPSETKHSVQGEPDALISAKDETIRLLTEQLEAERAANRENRRLLAAALERLPPALEEAAPEARESSEAASSTPWNGEPRSTTEEQEEPTSERSWWRRLLGE